MNLNKKGTISDVVEKYFKTLEFKKKISNNKTRIHTINLLPYSLIKVEDTI